MSDNKINVSLSTNIGNGVAPINVSVENKNLINISIKENIVDRAVYIEYDLESAFDVDIKYVTVTNYL